MFFLNQCMQLTFRSPTRKGHTWSPTSKIPYWLLDSNIFICAVAYQQALFMHIRGKMAYWRSCGEVTYTFFASPRHSLARWSHPFHCMVFLELFTVGIMFLPVHDLYFFSIYVVYLLCFHLSCPSYTLKIPCYTLQNKDSFVPYITWIQRKQHL
jgi:hypothetical protein